MIWLEVAFFLILIVLVRMYGRRIDRYIKLQKQEEAFAIEREHNEQIQDLLDYRRWKEQQYNEQYNQRAMKAHQSVIMDGLRFNIDSTSSIIEYIQMLEAQAFDVEEGEVIGDKHLSMLHEMHDQLLYKLELMEENHFYQTGKYHSRLQQQRSLPPKN